MPEKVFNLEVAIGFRWRKAERSVDTRDAALVIESGLRRLRDEGWYDDDAIELTSVHAKPSKKKKKE